MLYGKFLESKMCFTLQETNDQNPYEIVLISDTYQSPSDAWRISGNVNVIFPVITCYYGVCLLGHELSSLL